MQNIYKYAVCLFLGLSLHLTGEDAFAEKSSIVKRSSSGICHNTESPYFERVKNYERFDSLKSCVQSGGRPTAARNNARQPNESYERSLFGSGWDDADGDCQNERAEALIATSTLPVRFSADDRCRVISGRWISPFTGNVIHNASDIDIDHVVPLAWAYAHGAKEWSQEERERFANDLRNLWPVESSLNRSKGALGPDEWLPPEGQCQYTARFVRITKLYPLIITNSEQAQFESILKEC